MLIYFDLGARICSTQQPPYVTHMLQGLIWILQLNSLLVLFEIFPQYWERWTTPKWFYSPSTQNKFYNFFSRSKLFQIDLKSPWCFKNNILRKPKNGLISKVVDLWALRAPPHEKVTSFSGTLFYISVLHFPPWKYT